MNSWDMKRFFESYLIHLLSLFVCYNIWIFEFLIELTVSFHLFQMIRKFIIRKFRIMLELLFDTNTWWFLKCFQHLPTNGRSVLKNMLKWWYSHLLGGIYQYMFQFQSQLLLYYFYLVNEQSGKKYGNKQTKQELSYLFYCRVSNVFLLLFS